MEVEDISSENVHLLAISIDPTDDLPQNTEWILSCPHFPLPFITVPLVRRRFFRHWEISPCFPLIVTFLSFYCYFYFLFETLRSFPSRLLSIFAFFETFLCFLFFLWSYFAAVCMDPGFLPYNWVKTQKTEYSWEEQLSGFAIHSDQIEFAKSHKPSFASFSSQFGRFVIRADHICEWIANWVGKRNHKQFNLLIFWGFLTSVSLHFWTLMMKEERSYGHSLSLLVESSFGLSFIVLGLHEIWNICHNQTELKRWNGRTEEGLDCRRGFREVFGNGKSYLWCIPTPAFGENIFV
jgi:hypothetical protein